MWPSDGQTLTTGQNNTYVGDDAGQAATTSAQNTAVGADAMKQTTTGHDNTAVGKGALTANTTADDNVAIGKNSLYTATTGAGNTAVGKDAGYAVTTGANNVCIGYDAGDALTEGSNNIIIGYAAAASAVDVSNTVTLGDGNITAIRCQVQSISALSDARDKRGMKTLSEGLDFINDLNPVQFFWDMRTGEKVGVADFGFVAQELDATQRKYNSEDHLRLVLKDNPDRLEAAYGKLVPILVKAVQELSSQVKELKSKIEDG